VAPGLNEVLGPATSTVAQPSPQAGVECVWWRNRFYAQDEEGNWKKTKETEGGPVAFSLEDDSGSILVRPRHAAVHAPEVYDGPDNRSMLSDDANPSLVSRYIAGMTGMRRTKVVEHAIAVGDPVYVMGTAQLPLESLDVYIGPDRVGSEPFIVHVGSEKDALSTQRVATIAGFFAALAAAAGAGVAFADGQAIQRGGFDWATLEVSTPLAFAAPVLAIMAVAVVVFWYNGLVRLRHRAQAAWGLIDVQLRRRHDLIPNLVEAVRAHGAHEARVQASVAKLRSSLTPKLPRRPTDAAVTAADSTIREESAALEQLMALAETYPVLTADESYSALRGALVDTEDRVMLAREFYNNSI
ncbi:MAG: LemA family protein, partial [Acidimicrobiales bacterium]